MIHTLIIGTGVAGMKGLDKPNMLLTNNPLSRDPKEMIRERNMERLREDARLRGCPWNGHVYAGIMGMRYNGGD